MNNYSTYGDPHAMRASLYGNSLVTPRPDNPQSPHLFGNPTPYQPAEYQSVAPRQSLQGRSSSHKPKDQGACLPAQRMSHARQISGSPVAYAGGKQPSPPLPPPPNPLRSSARSPHASAPYPQRLQDGSSHPHHREHPMESSPIPSPQPPPVSAHQSVLAVHCGVKSCLQPIRGQGFQTSCHHFSCLRHPPFKKEGKIICIVCQKPCQAKKSEFGIKDDKETDMRNLSLFGALNFLELKEKAMQSFKSWLDAKAVEKAQLDNKMQKTAGALKQTMERIKQLEQIVQKAKAKIMQMAQENKRLNGGIATFKEREQQIRVVRDKDRDKINKLVEEIKRLTKRDQARAQEMLTAQAKTKENLQRAEAKENDALQKIGQMSASLEALEAERQRMRVKLEEKNQLISSLQGQLEAKDQDYRALYDTYQEEKNSKKAVLAEAAHREKKLKLKEREMERELEREREKEREREREKERERENEKRRIMEKARERGRERERAKERQSPHESHSPVLQQVRRASATGSAGGSSKIMGHQSKRKQGQDAREYERVEQMNRSKRERSSREVRNFSPDSLSLEAETSRGLKRIFSGLSDQWRGEKRGKKREEDDNIREMPKDLEFLERPR